MFGYPAVIGIALIFVFWLSFALLAVHRHGAGDGIKIIRAAGLYFPLRPRIPRRVRRGRDKSKGG